MKSPEEWITEWPEDAPAPFVGDVEFIAAIQDDALEHAATLCDGKSNSWGILRSYDMTCRAKAAQICALLIRTYKSDWKNVQKNILNEMTQEAQELGLYDDLGTKK